MRREWIYQLTTFTKHRRRYDTVIIIINNTIVNTSTLFHDLSVFILGQILSL